MYDRISEQWRRSRLCNYHMINYRSLGNRGAKETFAVLCFEISLVAQYYNFLNQTKVY
ncbi:unnamed protein product [Brassica oleracea]|uniref:(rape) hypothetical protein n=1 Tax=Brassica napus TaxID=3708 RepID=A0A816JD64_BRANA|nr:unnamed protein product [Brassica napus]